MRCSGISHGWTNSIEQTNAEGLFHLSSPKILQDGNRADSKACHQNGDYLLLLTARLPWPFFGGPLPRRFSISSLDRRLCRKTSSTYKQTDHNMVLQRKVFAKGTVVSLNTKCYIRHAVEDRKHQYTCPDRIMTIMRIQSLNKSYSFEHNLLVEFAVSHPFHSLKTKVHYNT
jgi:hypothetical protein